MVSLFTCVQGEAVLTALREDGLWQDPGQQGALLSQYVSILPCVKQESVLRWVVVAVRVSNKASNCQRRPSCVTSSGNGVL